MENALKKIIGSLDNFGAAIIRFLDYIGRMVSLLAAALYYVARLAIEWPITIVQMSVMGVNSMLIVFLVVSFTGMFLSLMLTQQAMRFGSLEFIGTAITFIMIRELAPVLTAVVMAGRVGSAIASELGSMKVTEQIDALHSLAVNPVRYLVVPRVVALVIMLPIVGIFAALVSILMAFLVSNSVGGVEWVTYFRSVPDFVEPWLIAGAMIKMVVFAAIIAIVGCVEGLYTEGGAVGVGRATINSVVLSLVLIFGSNFLLSMVLFKNS